MMGRSRRLFMNTLLKSIAEKMLSLFPTFRCITHKKARQQRNTVKKYHRSVSLPCCINKTDLRCLHTLA